MAVAGGYTDMFRLQVHFEYYDTLTLVKINPENHEQVSQNVLIYTLARDTWKELPVFPSTFSLGFTKGIGFMDEGKLILAGGEWDETLEPRHEVRCGLNMGCMDITASCTNWLFFPDNLC